MHPNAVVASPDKKFVYIANGNSDHVSVIDAQKLQVIDSIYVGLFKDNEALILRAVKPFVDERNEDQERFIDDLYLFKGPGTYEPRVEEVVNKYIEATIVLPNQALLCIAVKDAIDAFGQEHKAGTKVN